tara:strand:+ start:1638 stop:2087 length:450 start_codon:yes stop_codon:yes gene_type:complete
MGIEQQINQILQLIIPSIGYALYNFSFLIILISQLYSLDMSKAKLNVGLIHILCFIYQAVAIMFLFAPTAMEVDMTLTYLFLGMLGGSVRADKTTNPLKYVLLQLKDAGIMMKQDMIVAPINALRNKLVELEEKFYPEPEPETEDTYQF